MWIIRAILTLAGLATSMLLWFIRRPILLILAGAGLSVLLTGCGSANDYGSLAYLIKREKYLPRAFREAHFSGDPTPDPNDSYTMGFKQGCDDALGTFGEGFYRTIPLKFDGNKLTNDRWFLRGFTDGTSHCIFRIDWEVH